MTPRGVHATCGMVGIADSNVVPIPMCVIA